MSTEPWAEPLPANCPPEDAVPPGGKTFFRLVRSVPPTLRDFASSLAENPARQFNCTACIAHSTSIWSDLQAAAKRRKFSALEHHKIISLTLPDESGLVLKTFGPHHYSWWRKRTFDPLPRCQHMNA